MINALFFILLPIVAILPVFFIKNYLKSKNNNQLLYALCGYLGLTYLYIILLETCEMSKIFCISQVIQILLVVFGGILLYSEKITQNKIIGIIASITALYFLAK
jgi:uncharacterized membrane protein